jgi:hypothetical protein
MFRTDLIGLAPARRTMKPNGLVEDAVVREALTRHWKRAGFLPIRGSDILWL